MRMRDVENRNLVGGVPGSKIGHDQRLRRVIQPGEWLVEQQQIGIHHQRGAPAPVRWPSLLRLPRLAVEAMRSMRNERAIDRIGVHPRLRRDAIGARSRCCPFTESAGTARAAGTSNPDPALACGTLDARRRRVEQHSLPDADPSAVGPLQPRQAPQQRRLARAGGARRGS